MTQPAAPESAAKATRRSARNRGGSGTRGGSTSASGSKKALPRPSYANSQDDDDEFLDPVGEGGSEAA